MRDGTGRAEPRHVFDFKKPVAIPGDGFVAALVATSAFQRLKGIRFLGAIDYLRVRSPNGRIGSRRYTRFQHSLGVFRLALLYGEAAALPLEERRLAAAAALLHDIGHAPFSHSLEPVFRNEFGIDHHAATEAILKGDVPLGQEVAAVLRSERIDGERLAATIRGDERVCGGFFAGPINFDTIEGILRTQTYERPAPRVASPESVVLAAARRASHDDRLAVDEFWTYKDLVYRSIINADGGILADALFQHVMRRHIREFTKGDFYATEAALFRKMPTLRRLLHGERPRRAAAVALGRHVRFKARRFTIDPEGDFFAGEDGRRYRQSRSDAVLHLPLLTEADDHPVDLFDAAPSD